MRPTVAVVLVAWLALAGCSGDPQDDYCEAVEDHQPALTEVAASEDPGALFDALGTYDDLAAEAPRDIADEWASVIEPLRRLEQVLDDHGVDASSYVADATPPDLDGDARKAVEAAAHEVGSRRTVEAMAAVEQHALDVCGTPLSR